MGRNADEMVAVNAPCRWPCEAPYRQALSLTSQTHKQGNTAFSSQFSSESHVLQLKKGKLSHELGPSSARGAQVALSAGLCAGTIMKTKQKYKAGPHVQKADALGERGKEKYSSPECMCLVGQSTGGESEKRHPDLPLGPQHVAPATATLLTLSSPHSCPSSSACQPVSKASTLALPLPQPSASTLTGYMGVLSPAPTHPPHGSERDFATIQRVFKSNPI